MTTSLGHYSVKVSASYSKPFGHESISRLLLGVTLFMFFRGMVQAFSLLVIHWVLTTLIPPVEVQTVKTNIYLYCCLCQTIRNCYKNNVIIFTNPLKGNKYFGHFQVCSFPHPSLFPCIFSTFDLYHLLVELENRIDEMRCIEKTTGFLERK